MRTAFLLFAALITDVNFPILSGYVMLSCSSIGERFVPHHFVFCIMQAQRLLCLLCKLIIVKCSVGQQEVKRLQ